jgi:hypothetical protein
MAMRLRTAVADEGIFGRCEVQHTILYGFDVVQESDMPSRH